MCSQIQFGVYMRVGSLFNTLMLVLWGAFFAIGVKIPGLRWFISTVCIDSVESIYVLNNLSLFNRHYSTLLSVAYSMFTCWLLFSNVVPAPGVFRSVF